MCFCFARALFKYCGGPSAVRLVRSLDDAPASIICSSSARTADQRQPPAFVFARRLNFPRKTHGPRGNDSAGVFVVYLPERTMTIRTRKF